MLLSQKKQNKADKKIFKNIFKDHWDEFKDAYPQYDNDQYDKPVQKMLGCGEDSGGYKEHSCHCGQDDRKVPFSCKSGFCLSCSKKYTDDFVSQVSGMLYQRVTYRHVVLTIPKQLRQLFYRERHTGDLLSGFMKCGYECLEDAVSTVKRKKMKIGCIVTVHTNGRSGKFNPHLHIIMTSGGINTDTNFWLELGYFDYGLIREKWKYHLLKFVRSFFGAETDDLVDELDRKYKGFVVRFIKKKCLRKTEILSGIWQNIWHHPR